MVDEGLQVTTSGAPEVQGGRKLRSLISDGGGKVVYALLFGFLLVLSSAAIVYLWKGFQPIRFSYEWISLGLATTVSVLLLASLVAVLVI